MITRNKPLERNYGVSEQGANRSKETGEFRKRLEKVEIKRLETLKTRGKLLERNQRIFTKRSKPLERDQRISKETR